MKFKLLKNISDKDIEDYPIAEAQVDAQNEVKYDDEGKIMVTDRTLKWTIKSGETGRVPAYVADILLQRYGVEDKDSGRAILEEVEATDKKEDLPTVKGIKKDFTCKVCGKSFKSPKALGLHLGHQHPSELSK